MEFHGTQFLPNGLPEIIYQITPPELRSDLYVIGHRRKKRRGLLGQAHWGEGANPNRCDISLFCFPILAHRPSTWVCTITRTSQVWLSFLEVALHEIGHVVNPGPLRTQGEYGHNARLHQHIEHLADTWMRAALWRIERVSPRMAQPPGAMKGLPGHILFEWSRRTITFHSPDALADNRAVRSGGQVAVSGPIYAVGRQLGVQWWELQDPTDYQRQYRRLHSLICNAADGMGIARFFVNRRGWRYRMFNFGEARAVIARAVALVREGELKWPVVELRPVEPPVVCLCGSDLVWTVGEGYSFEEKLCGACGYRFDVASGPRTRELLSRPKEQRRLRLRVRKTTVQRK